MARILLIAGRAMLVIGLGAVVICRVTRGVWAHAPQDAGVPSHWIANTSLVVLFVVALLMPFLVLPVGSFALVGRIGSPLRVPTVLGTRRVSLESVRATRLSLPGRGWNLELVLLRDSRHRLVIVAASGFWFDSNDLDLGGRDGISGQGAQSLTRRARRSAVGWLAVLVWGFATLFVFSVLSVMAGVL
jgi:hypothetical protein